MIRGSVRAERAISYARNTLVNRHTLANIHERLVAMYGDELEGHWQRRGLALLEDAIEELNPGALERLVGRYAEENLPSWDEGKVEMAYWHAEVELAADLGLAPPLSSRVLDENAVRWAELITHAVGKEVR